MEKHETSVPRRRRTAEELKCRHKVDKVAKIDLADSSGTFRKVSNETEVIWGNIKDPRGRSQEYSRTATGILGIRGKTRSHGSKSLAVDTKQ